MADINEAYLLQRLKEGDIHALEIIFNQHYSNLCKYLLLLFKNQMLVDHIAQDIFVYIWENRKTIEIKSSLESYLYAAGRYKALNKIRDAKRRQSIEEQMENICQETEEPSDIMLEQKELESIIEEAISSLPERCQQIFRLSREEEMSYKEIAGFLNISINTVEGQMAIALKKLRSTLKPFYVMLLLMA
jgi:RNA polymerase sigma-70 factor, ECF subfamily